MTAHARRVIKTLAGFLFVLLLAGFTYQGVATALERRAFKYPGRLVPVGDHQLHLYCVGSGTPTAVLEAPALGFSASWALVQTPVSEVTRVCSYDRAGLGWSEASDGTFDTTLVADELSRLLSGAGERGPFVLVGEGLGAAYVTDFAARFPSETKALLLLSPPTHENPSGGTTLQASPSPWLARIGILRLSQLVSRGGVGLPGPEGGAVAAFSMRPDHLTRSGQEMRQFDNVVRRAEAITLPPELPVTRVDVAGGHSALGSEQGAAEIVRAIIDVVQNSRTSP